MNFVAFASSAQYHCGQLVRGLKHLHSHQIVHRDLKPEEIQGGLWLVDVLCCYLAEKSTHLPQWSIYLIPTHKSLHSFVESLKPLAGYSLHMQTPSQTFHSNFWIDLLQNLLITHDDVLKIADFGWFNTQIYPWTALRIHLSPRCQSDGVNEGARMSIWWISWNWGPPNPQLRNYGQCQQDTDGFWGPITVRFTRHCIFLDCSTPTHSTDSTALLSART